MNPSPLCSFSSLLPSTANCTLRWVVGLCLLYSPDGTHAPELETDRYLEHLEGGRVRQVSNGSLARMFAWIGLTSIGGGRAAYV